jgi:predicted TIM-barrel fold metal-dependent hydrolase
MPVVPIIESVAPRMPSAPLHALPAGACDAHAHVFGPYDRFPFVTPSSYPPPLAPFELHKEMLTRIGAQRGVLVQPAPYGTDSSALVDALRRGKGQIRGIAVATEEITDKELYALQQAGVRGLRFNEMIDSGTGKMFKGSVGVDQLKKLAPRMKELGWHAQLWAKCADCVAISRELASLGLTFVYEHMTSFAVDNGTDDPAFHNLLALMKEGQIWVKLALCRVSKAFPDYADLRPFHDSLVEANPSRLLWASDWPYVRMGDRSPDVGHLVDLFSAWVDDAEVRNRILVNNPDTLYGFESLRANGNRSAV